MYLNIISKYFILFMMYSFAGWLMETSWVSYSNKKIVDRGFLIGPYCPIYGFGAILIVLLLNRFSFNPVVLFLATMIVCGALEYFTSWYMEKVFKARWWDYSDRKININGRICLRNLIAFGVMGLVVIYFINPHFEKWIGYLNEEYLRGLFFILWTIFIIDFVLSTIVVYGFRTITEKVNKEGMADNTEQITKMVREQLAKKSFFHKRFLDAYPKLEAIRIKMKEIKAKIEDATNDAREAVAGKVNDMKDIVTDKINDAKEAVTEKTEIIRTNIEEGTRKAKIRLYIGKKHITETFRRKKGDF